MRQVKIYLSDDQYERLRKLAEAHGLTPSRYVKLLVLEALGEVEYGGLAARVRMLEQKYEQLAREVGRIEKDLALLLKKLGITLYG